MTSKPAHLMIYQLFSSSSSVTQLNTFLQCIIGFPLPFRHAVYK